MTHDFAPGVTSISSNVLLLSSVVSLLEHVERLPSGATGALAYGEGGVILVENRRICWAVARDMRARLTDILCQQREPPLERAHVEAIYRSCQQQGTPLGEALVEQGLVSESELRAALERHTCEALVRIAQSAQTAPTGFDRHSSGGYQPRFVFGAAELLASLSGQRRAQLAAQARSELAGKLVPDAYGFAFLREPGRREPVLIAVDRASELPVAAALGVARWVLGALELAAYVDAQSALLSGTWCERMSLVAWRREGVYYAALCSSRPASARLLSRLAPQRVARATQEAT
jgi:hypothetical protein